MNFNLICGIISILTGVLCIIWGLPWGYAALNFAVGIFNIGIGLVYYED